MKNKNSYSNKASGFNKHKKHSVMGAIGVLAVAALTVLSLLLTGCGAGTDKTLAEAEEYLLSHPYKLVLTESRESTDDDINELINSGESKITVIVNGSAFAYTETLGEGSISYLCLGDTLYIDESVINLCTKSKVTEEEIAKLRDDLVTVFTAKDYQKSDKDKTKDGDAVITLKDPTEDKINSLMAGIGENTQGSGISIGIDLDQTRTVVVLDSEGRYKSITQTYAFSVDYDDGYSALITMTAKKEYTYDKVETLREPAGTYIDSSNGYRDLFGASFEVTTNVVTSTGNQEILNRLNGISVAFGGVGHSILRVDGNNYELTYPNTNEPDEGETVADGISEVMTLIDNMLYSNYTTVLNGVQSSEKLKQELDEQLRTYYYRNSVINNLFPSYARDYLDISSSTDANGVTTVTCKVINKSIYDALNDAMNRGYIQSSNIRLTPKADDCKYVVKFDESGRFLSTQLTVMVAVDDVLTGMEYADEWMVLERSFDYEKAEDYYDSVGEALDPWITEPSDADDYIDRTGY